MKKIIIIVILVTLFIFFYKQKRIVESFNIFSNKKIYTKEIGGYNDKSARALPHFLGNVGTYIDGFTGKRKQNGYDYTYRRCYDLAKLNGYKYFGLQYPPLGQCFAGNDYEKATQYGKANCGKTGGSWQNYIYEILPKAQYLDKSSFCKGTPDQKLYISANSDNYKKIGKNIFGETFSLNDCEKACSKDGSCQMFLRDPQKNCRLYNKVSNVKMYCDSGPGHSFHGNIKTDNMIKKENVIDMNTVSLPPLYDYYIPQNSQYKMPYTQHCQDNECPYTGHYTTCRMDFNEGYSKERVENWLTINNLEAINKSGIENDNENGNTSVSCKAMGYELTTSDLEAKYKKIGWIEQPFSCQAPQEIIEPELNE